MAIIVATRNPGKLNEIKDLLNSSIELLTLEQMGHFEELVEEQDTLEGNAIQKAEFIYNKYNKSCIADDSGLEVTALSGAPGVYSATYAGSQRRSDDNITLLLSNLKGVVDRSARFRTVIAYCDEHGIITCFEGILKGQIITERRGNGGFGYDAVFVPDGHTLTLAQMSITEKNTISHRATAVRELATMLLSHSADTN